MPKRKSPENKKGKNGSKATEREPTRQFARFSEKPASPKPEPKPRKKNLQRKNLGQGVICWSPLMDWDLVVRS